MSEAFTNEPIAVDDLPRLRNDSFVSVDPRYVWGQLAGLTVTAVAVVAIAGAVVWVSGAVLWPTVVGGVVAGALVALATGSMLEARRLAYQLREYDLSLRSGVVRHRVETIPFSRIQHVSVGRGLVERSLGLATLEVSSAGPDIAVPGLSVADAERIKQVVAERAGVDDEAIDSERDEVTAGRLGETPPSTPGQHWPPPPASPPPGSP